MLIKKHSVSVFCPFFVEALRPLLELVGHKNMGFVVLFMCNKVEAYATFVGSNASIGSYS